MISTTTVLDGGRRSFLRPDPFLPPDYSALRLDQVRSAIHKRRFLSPKPISHDRGLAQARALLHAAGIREIPDNRQPLALDLNPGER